MTGLAWLGLVFFFSGGKSSHNKTAQPQHSTFSQDLLAA
jgi:hypothetical protein